MARFLKILAAFFAGLIATWVAVVAAGVAYMDWFNIFDRDGGGSMGLIFVIGPFFGTIGGIAAAIWMGMRTRRR